jgi:hypothetical protein
MRNLFVQNCLTLVKGRASRWRVAVLCDSVGLNKTSVDVSNGWVRQRRQGGLGRRRLYPQTFMHGWTRECCSALSYFARNPEAFSTLKKLRSLVNPGTGGLASALPTLDYRRKPRAMSPLAGQSQAE